MAEKNCPKCNKKNEDTDGVCRHCGINFDEYETAKQEKFIEIRVLLSENRFHEAKALAEKLPMEFPDNRTDFLLLLSNINRDISIVEKFEHAQKAYEGGDFKQVSLILRNIKAFDHNLNEKVISLRRKAERYLQNEANFARAEELYFSGKQAEARALFKQIQGFDKQDEVDDYLAKIDYFAQTLLDEAIGCIRGKQFDAALEKFDALQVSFPDMKERIERYKKLLDRRVEIKDTILDAAKRAKKEKRLLESKVLYSFLGLQFPEFMSQVQPHIDEIGNDAVISMADVGESSGAELAALGLDAGGGGQFAARSQEDCREYVAPDSVAPDCDKDGNEELAAVESSRASAPDTAPEPLAIDKEGIADFTL